MSSLNPDFSLIQRYVEASLKKCCQDIKGKVDGQGNQEKVQKVFTETIHNLKQCPFRHSITAHELAMVKQLEAKNLLDPLTQIVGKDALSSTSKVLHVFNSFLQNQQALGKAGLAPYLNQPWAQDLLKALLEESNEHALTFIMDMCEDSKLCEDLIVEYKDNPKFRAHLESNLGSEDLEKVESAVNTFVILLQKSQPGDWAREKLVGLFSEEDIPDHAYGLKFLFQSDLNSVKWLVPTLLDAMEKNSSLAGHIFDWLREASFNAALEEFYQGVLQRALAGNELLQNCAVLFAATKPTLQKFFEDSLSSGLEKFEEVPIQSQIWLVNAKRWADKLQPFIQGDCVELFHRPSYYFQTFNMAIDSYRALHLFFLKGVTQEHPFKVYTELFPPARSIIMGDSMAGMYERGDPHDALKVIAEKMARDLKSAGIEICQVTTAPQNLRTGTRPLVGEVKDWMQDYGHFAKGKGGKAHTLIPNFLLDFGHAVGHAIEPEWVGKYGGQGKTLREGHLFELANMHFCQTEEASKSIQMSWSYLEGGNAKFGVDELGAPYLIIGKESFEMIRATLMEELRDVGYVHEKGQWQIKPGAKASKPVVSDEMVFEVISRDFGVAQDHIYPITQPHEFHIDMGMNIIGPKIAILNDSEKALELSLEVYKGAKEPAKLKAAAKEKRGLEEKTKGDLEAAGFSVIELPGNLVDYSQNPPENRANMFNFITLTPPKDPTRKIVYSLHLPKEGKAVFEKVLAQQAGVKVEDIHYLEERESLNLLLRSGGLNCVTQVLEHAL